MTLLYSIGGYFHVEETADKAVAFWMFLKHLHGFVKKSNLTDPCE